MKDSSNLYVLQNILNTNDKSEPVPHLENSVRIIMRCHMSIKKIQTVITHQNQLEAQRSGFELERRSKGAERSFKAAPKRDRLETEWSGFRSDVVPQPISNPNFLCPQKQPVLCLLCS